MKKQISRDRLDTVLDVIEIMLEERSRERQGAIDERNKEFDRETEHIRIIEDMIKANPNFDYGADLETRLNDLVNLNALRM